jgi:hypothetical protein
MADLRRLPRAFLPPVLLLAMATLVGLCVIFVPDPPRRLAVIPLPHQVGGFGAAEFHAARDEYYGLDVEMDQAAAKRLYPCTADPERFDDPACAEAVMPVALSFTLLADGVELRRATYSAKGVHGGRYGGAETFGLGFEAVKLKRGPLYRLEVRALSDSSALAAAAPRVVVEADTIDRVVLALYRALAEAAALGLALVAGLWAGAAALLRRRAARRARTIPP